MQFAFICLYSLSAGAKEPHRVLLGPSEREATLGLVVDTWGGGGGDEYPLQARLLQVRRLVVVVHASLAMRGVRADRARGRRESRHSQLARSVHSLSDRNTRRDRHATASHQNGRHDRANAGRVRRVGHRQPDRISARRHAADRHRLVQSVIIIIIIEQQQQQQSTHFRQRVQRCGRGRVVVRAAGHVLRDTLLAEVVVVVVGGGQHDSVESSECDRPARTGEQLHTAK